VVVAALAETIDETINDFGGWPIALGKMGQRITKRAEQ
jgi:hypothetical protein